MRREIRAGGEPRPLRTGHRVLASGQEKQNCGPRAGRPRGRQRRHPRVHRRSGEATQLPRSLPRVWGWPPRGRWLCTAQHGARASRRWPRDQRAAGHDAPSTACRPVQGSETDFSSASSAPCSSTGPRLRVSDTGKPKFAARQKAANILFDPFFFFNKNIALYYPLYYIKGYNLKIQDNPSS